MRPYKKAGRIHIWQDFTKQFNKTYRLQGLELQYKTDKTIGWVKAEIWNIQGVLIKSKGKNLVVYFSGLFQI